MFVVPISIELTSHALQAYANPSQLEYHADKIGIEPMTYRAVNYVTIRRKSAKEIESLHYPCDCSAN